MRKLSSYVHVAYVFTPEAEGMNESSVNERLRGRRSRCALIRSPFQFLASLAGQVRQSPRTVAEDPEWAIAMRVPIETSAVDVDGDIVGVVMARRHPTGWFISASRRTGMSKEEVADFGHFVSVRVYILLHCGPGVDTWASDVSSGQWRAYLRGEARPQAAHVPGWASLS